MKNYHLNHSEIAWVKRHFRKYGFRHWESLAARPAVAKSLMIRDTETVDDDTRRNTRWLAGYDAATQKEV